MGWVSYNVGEFCQRSNCIGKVKFTVQSSYDHNFIDRAIKTCSKHLSYAIEDFTVNASQYEIYRKGHLWPWTALRTLYGARKLKKSKNIWKRVL